MHAAFILACCYPVILWCWLTTTCMILWYSLTIYIQLHSSKRICAQCLVLYILQLTQTHLPLEEMTRRTIQVFLSTVKSILEDPNEIPDILQHIAECNAAADLPGRDLPHWPSEFHTQYTSCVLCHSSLSQPGCVPGSNGKAYLLSRNKLVPVTCSVHLKVH